MKTVGSRKLKSITLRANAQLLKEGALFNDEMHKLPTGAGTQIRKGIHRFKCHEDANKHQDSCEIDRMVKNAL